MTGRWAAIARKDTREVWDSRLLRYLLYLVVLVYVLAAYVYPIGRPSVTTTGFTEFATGPVGLIVPLVAVLIGYNAVVGERATGRLALALSLPHDRRGIVLGKLLGRGGVLVAGLLVGLVGAAALVVYPFGSLESLRYLGYAGVTVLFGLAFFAIAVGLSMATTSKGLATAAALGVFFLFVVVWDLVRTGLRVLLDQLGVAGSELPVWAQFLHGAEPGQLYERIVAGLIADEQTGPYLGADAPWYLGEWVALGLLCLWIVGPLVIGYRQFARTDL